MIHLPERQKICAEHLLMNKTYRQIGKDMGISKRTVEHYISIIKVKLDCDKKRELINKLKEEKFM